MANDKTDIGQSHRKLIAWQKAVGVVTLIYKITDKFPETEKFGLVSQLRRAAVSIASNIAEGSARFGNAEKIKFYMISRGSLAEIDTQMEISYRLNFIDLAELNKTLLDVEELNRILNGLIRSRRRN